MEQKENLSSSETGLSLVCHLSMFFGAFIVPLIIYFVQKGKSRFVSFNALQAVYFHLLYMFVGLIMIVIMMVGIGIGTEADRRGDAADAPATAVIISFIVFFAVMLFFIINAIIAAVKSYQGQIRKYPIVGGIAYRQVYAE